MNMCTSLCLNTCFLIWRAVDLGVESWPYSDLMFNISRNCPWSSVHASPPPPCMSILFQIHAGTRFHCDFLPGGSLQLLLTHVCPSFSSASRNFAFAPWYLHLYLHSFFWLQGCVSSPGTQLQSHKNRDRPLFCAQRHLVLFLPFYCWAILVTTGDDKNRFDSVVHEAQIFTEMGVSQILPCLKH